MYKQYSAFLTDYEQFNTLITQIEAIVNSRPLIRFSSDPNVSIALNPGHFLRGDLLTNSPEYDVSAIPHNKLSLWQHLQKLRLHCWARWSKKCLHRLHTRWMWHLGSPSQVKQGTLVIIQEDNTPPMRWKLGRIIATHPGEDIVRVATGRTSHGTYKRSIEKLFPVPVRDIDAAAKT